MIVKGEAVKDYKIMLDGEAFNDIVFEADTNDGSILFVVRNTHFPYWPQIIYGKVTLEKINNG